MQEVQTCTNLLHPFILHTIIANEHQAPRTQIAFQNNQYTIIGN
jgi:hypothetical protein